MSVSSHLLEKNLSGIVLFHLLQTSNLSGGIDIVPFSVQNISLTTAHLCNTDEGIKSRQKSSSCHSVLTWEAIKLDALQTFPVVWYNFHTAFLPLPFLFLKSNTTEYLYVFFVDV